MEKVFNSEVIIQTDKNTPIQSIYCFGKNHRPDMTLGENGIAIELKSITCAGLKDTIGQGLLKVLKANLLQQDHLPHCCVWACFNRIEIHPGADQLA